MNEHPIPSSEPTERPSAAPTAGDYDSLPDTAWLAALAGLPGVGPARLAKLLRHGEPGAVWQRVLQQPAALASAIEAPNLAGQWQEALPGIDVHALWETYQSRGVGALSAASPAYPRALAEDPDPPAVLFCEGSPDVLAPLRVGIVGTRKCTRYGVDLAHALGAMLAAEGVTVVSGLAAGIDAAAHLGALSVLGGAPPVGIAGSALDRPYPRVNTQLWRQVAAEGLMCSETPLGAPTERWRFPARNRVIAALSQVVVVVESHEKGGSLYTAQQAMDRGRTVFAVPGSIHSPASSGCNRLLLDGCLPLCEPQDVLVALGLAATTLEPLAPVPVSALGLNVAETLGWRPTSLDEICQRLITNARPSVEGPPAPADLTVDDVAYAVEGLVAQGVLVWRGRWLERTAQQVVLAGPGADGLPHAT